MNLTLDIFVLLHLSHCQLAEEQALEPVRMQAALDSVQQEDDQQTNAQVAEERDKASVELETQRRLWVSFNNINHDVLTYLFLWWLFFFLYVCFIVDTVT